MLFSILLTVALSQAVSASSCLLAIGSANQFPIPGTNEGFYKVQLVRDNQLVCDYNIDGLRYRLDQKYITVPCNRGKGSLKFTTDGKKATYSVGNEHFHWTNDVVRVTDFEGQSNKKVISFGSSVFCDAGDE